MSNRNIDGQISKIEISDTISQFMEKCNNNFSTLVKWGGGPDGNKGDKGDQGIPAKPKVPIHVWIKGKEYDNEIELKNSDEKFELEGLKENLNKVNYQEGHLIMLENGHVYILNVDDFELKPKFLIAMQSLDPEKFIDGRTPYLHIAYSDSQDGTENFITDQELRNQNSQENNIETFNLTNVYINNSNVNTTYSSNRAYIGVYSDFDENPKGQDQAYYYTWIRLRNLEYKMELSNPISPIYIGEDNCCINNHQESTLIYLYDLYDNMLDVSTNENIEISLPKDEYKDYFSIEKTKDNIQKVVFKPIIKNEKNEEIPFKFTINTPYKLPITLTYNYNKNSNIDNNKVGFTTTLNWILTPIKMSEDIKVFVDKKNVNISDSNIQTFNVGYYLTSNGSKKIINTNNNIGYKIILTSDINDFKQKDALENWENVTYNFVNENGESRNCYVVLVEENNMNIVDYTMITSVKNGVDGMYLSLTNEHVILQYNIDGSGIHESQINEPIESQMILYEGNKKIKNDIEYSIHLDDNYEETSLYDVNINQDNGSFSFKLSNVKRNSKVKCVAKYNGTEFQKELFIELKETPYKLELNKTLLSRDQDNSIKLKDSYIYAYIKYYINGEWIDSDETYNIKASWVDQNENEYYEYFKCIEEENYKYYHFRINDKNLKNNNEIYNIEISCFKNNNTTKELFHKTIKILSDGKDGQKVGIKKHENDGYYWVLDENYLTDEEGNYVKYDSLETNRGNSENKIIIENDNITVKGANGSEVAKISSNEFNITYNNINTTINNEGVIVKMKDENSENFYENFKINNDGILIKFGNYGLKITNDGIKKTTYNVETETWDDSNL